jgi:hypothetical protein
MTSTRTAVTIALLLAAAAASAALPPDVEHFLTVVAGFSPSDIASIERGEVVAKAQPGPSDTELMTAAAVKIRATRQQTASYYGQMITYVDGTITQAFGRFSTPAALADVRDLSLDSDEIAELKSCRPGRCGVRIGGAGLSAIRSAVDFNRPDAATQVNARVRQAVVDYVNAYLTNGDAALVRYGDRSEPVSAQDEWRAMVADSPYFQQYSPALREYLEQYPRRTLAGARDVLYWLREKYTGLKPVTSIVHGVVFQPPDQPDRTIVVQKQLYASHYYDGSVAVAALMDAGDGGTYLVYGNRSRGDLLKGGFGGLKKKVALKQAEQGAEQTLGTIKSVLEGR